MATVGRLKQGNILITGEVKEVSPDVTNGVVAYFPLDEYGSVSKVMDTVPVLSPVFPYQNLIEVNVDWKNPANWSTNNWVWTGGTPTCEWDSTEQALKFTAGAGWSLNSFIQIDPTKQWYIEATVRTNQGHAGFYLGDISYNKSKGQTTQHPGTYEYFGASNMTIPASYITVRNAGIGGIARTGTSPTASDTTMWDTSMYYIKPQVIVNYNAKDSTFITWIQDIRLYYVNTDTSNIIRTTSGYSLQEATTNLVPSPSVFSSGWTNYSNGHDGAFVTEFGTEGLNISNRISWSGAYRTITLPSAGTYTISVWVKPIARTSTSINITLYTSGGGLSDQQVTADWSPSKIGEWQRLSMTRTFTTTSFVLYLICYGGAQTSDYKISAQYTMPQVEQRQFATAFVDGSSSAGSLSIPAPLTGSNWTIFYRYTPYVKWSAYYTSGSYSKYQWYIYDSVTGKKIWYADYKGATPSDTSDPWIGFDEFVTSAYTVSGGWHWHNPNMTMDPNKEYWYALTKNGSVWTKHWVYSQGYGNQTITHTDTGINSFIPDRIQFTGEFNNTIRDVTIYNKALSITEIQALAANNTQIKNNGNINTTEVQEGSVSLPSDAIYIPLSIDGNSISGNVKPLTESNVGYSGGAAWVGEGYANLFTHSPVPTFSLQTGKVFEVLGYDTDGVIYRHSFAGETWNYKGQTLSLTANTTYTLSADIYVSEDFNGNYNPYITSESAGGSAAYNISKKGTWQHVSKTFTIGSSNVNSNILMYPCPNNATATKGYVLYKNVQLTASSYERAFVNGSRSYSRLNYTGNTLTKNSWQTFSMSMWVKYSDLSRWRLSGAWTKFYFGVGTNDKVCFSWIENSSNTGNVQQQRGAIYGATNVPKNEWVMISCVVVPNTSIKLYLNGNLDLNWAGSFYMNVGGDNFELNSIDTGSTSYPINGWIRDFIILDRAMTDVEVSNLYRNQMSSRKDGVLLIQNQLKEGELL